MPFRCCERNIHATRARKMIMEVRKNEWKRRKTNVKLLSRKTDIAWDSVIIRLIYAQTDVMKFVVKKGGDTKRRGIFNECD